MLTRAAPAATPMAGQRCGRSSSSRLDMAKSAAAAASSSAPTAPVGMAAGSDAAASTLVVGDVQHAAARLAVHGVGVVAQ